MDYLPLEIPTSPVSAWQLYLNFWGWFGLVLLLVGLGPLAYFIWLGTEVSSGIDSSTSMIPVVFAGVLEAVCVGVGGGIALVHGRNVRRAVRTRDTGEKRSAVIQGTQVSNFTINDVQLVRLTWLDEKGCAGKSKLHNPEELTLFPTGRKITIYADPAGRNPSVWEGNVGPANSDDGDNHRPRERWNSKETSTVRHD